MIKAPTLTRIRCDKPRMVHGLVPGTGKALSKLRRLLLIMTTAWLEHPQDSGRNGRVYEVPAKGQCCQGPWSSPSGPLVTCRLEGMNIWTDSLCLFPETPHPTALKKGQESKETGGIINESLSQKRNW